MRNLLGLDAASIAGGLELTAEQQAAEQRAARALRPSFAPIGPLSPAARSASGTSAPVDSAQASSSPAQSTSGVAPNRSAVAAAADPAIFPAEDLPGWSLVLAEDFTRDAPLGQFTSTYRGWAGYDGGRDTSRNYGRPADSQGLYSSATTTSVHDGTLDEFIHTEGVTPQIMALTPTADGAWWSGQTYGRYAVRFRTDAVPGYKIAWMLWPSRDDWNQGEVDFPEGMLGGSIMSAAHDVTGQPARNAFGFDAGSSMADWHTAVIEWTPGRLTYLLDGRSWTTTDPTAVPTERMRWVLQTETEVSQTPDPAVSGHVYIDWVAAWRPS